MEPEDVIYSMKKQLENILGIPGDGQCLIYAGDILEDDKTLNDYNITNNAQLSLRHHKVFVRTTEGDLLTVQCSLMDHILSIKEKIKKQTGQPLDHQILRHEAKILEDDKTLAFYNIPKDSVLTLTYRIELVVKECNGKGLTLFSSPDDTIDNLKSMIEQHERIPAERQRLFYGESELHKGNTLSYYGITKSSTLQFRLWIHIFVKTSTEKTIQLKVLESDTVSHVKELIQKEENIHPCRQMLTFNTRSLEDTSSLSHYNIQHNDTINLVISKYSFVFIKTLTGQTIAMEVKLDERILNMKARVEEKEGIPKDQQGCSLEANTYKTIEH